MRWEFLKTFPITFSQIADGGDLEPQMFGLTIKFNKMSEIQIKHENPAIGNVLLAEVLHPDSDIDAELYHEEINESEKRECRYCGDNTNAIEEGCCYTCYRQHCR